METKIIDIEAVRRTISDINRRCSNAGLRALDRMGKQKDEYWLPEEIKELLIAEHERPEGKKTGLVLVKYFSPVGSATWWLSEYDPTSDTFFGNCLISEKELGYVSRQELRETPCPMGLWIERDFYFDPRPLDNVS